MVSQVHRRKESNISAVDTRYVLRGTARIQKMNPVLPEREEGPVSTFSYHQTQTVTLRVPMKVRLTVVPQGLAHSRGLARGTACQVQQGTPTYTGLSLTLSFSI